MYDTKSIFASKTALVGALVVVVGALQGLDWIHLVPSGPVAGYIASGLGVVMIVLRSLTSQPVTLSGK